MANTLMNSSLIRKALAVSAFVLTGMCANAQEADTTLSVPIEQPAVKTNKMKYDSNVTRYRNRWDKVIPRYYKLQFAGNMGIVSIGTGWDYGKKKQWETDFLVGYVPKYSTTHGKVTLTLKQNFMPWRIPIRGKMKRFMIEPLTTGLYMNCILDGDFWANEPDKYPSSYYSFSTKIRFNVFMGSRITYDRTEKSKYFRSCTLFYEISSNDLYIASAATNKYLKLQDILSLSIGMKFQIF